MKIVESLEKKAKLTRMYRGYVSSCLGDFEKSCNNVLQALENTDIELGKRLMQIGHELLSAGDYDAELSSAINEYFSEVGYDEFIKHIIDEGNLFSKDINEIMTEYDINVVGNTPKGEIVHRIEVPSEETFNPAQESCS